MITTLLDLDLIEVIRGGNVQDIAIVAAAKSDIGRDRGRDIRFFLPVGRIGHDPRALLIPNRHPQIPFGVHDHPSGPSSGI